MTTEYNYLDIRRGDIFFVDECATYGSEQRTNRPAIVVSNDLANRHSPCVEVVFLTSQQKKHLPTHVNVRTSKQSTALCENIQTVDKGRLSTYLKSCTSDEMDRIDEALGISLGLSRYMSKGE